MKRNLALVIITALIFLNISGCSNRMVTSPTIDTNPKEDKNLMEIKFDFDKAESYVLSKCRCYDDSNVLLAFKKPGEDPYLKLFSYNMDMNTSDLLYDGPFSVDYGDSILLNDQQIGYQNFEKAIIYDRKSKSLIKEFTKPDADKFICYSPDMKYLAEVCADGLYITDNNSSEKKKIDDTSTSYASLTWANDSSKLLYITDQRSNISMIDINSMRKRTLYGGKDFKNPDGLVELSWCRYLPNNSDILVIMLCENNDAFAVLNSSRNYESNIIPENGHFTTMAVSDHLILYGLDENNSKEYKLICYDYVNNTKNIIFSTTDCIVCADFSPEGNKIIFGTYLDGKHELYTYSVN